MKDIKVYTYINSRNLFVKVEGKASFLISPEIKKYILAKLQNDIDMVYIDLSKCQSMDSTFMGSITSISKYTLSSKKEKLKIINITPHSYRLLETLGLNVFFHIIDDYKFPMSPVWMPFEIENLDKYVTTRHMLDSHETIIELNQQNSQQFHKIRDMLKENLKKQEQEQEQEQETKKDNKEKQ